MQYRGAAEDGVLATHLRGGEKPDSRPSRTCAWRGGWRVGYKSVQRVSYHQAEAGAKSLAAELSAAFSRSELARFGYVAIPRSGHFVLGMLAYVLDLGPRQLLRQPADAPVVLVDDCALTGLRFQQMLQSLPHERVIFAHLYSHPALRQAIASRSRA